MKTSLTHRSFRRSLHRRIEIRRKPWIGRRFSILLLGLGLCGSPTVNAALIPGLFNTGVDNDDTPLVNRSFDHHYSLVGGSPIVGTPITATSASGFPIPPWLADSLFSTWIAPTTNTYGPGATDGSAVYYYQIQFNLTGLEPATAAISGQWSTDNYGSNILINGVSTGQANSSQFGAWTPFLINRGFVAGTNTLTFVVNNGFAELTPDGPTGLRVEMTGTASLAPSIPSLFNTGVDALGTPRTDDAGELHYRLVGASAVTGTPSVATSSGGFPIGPWLGDNAVSAWIAPSSTTDGPNATNGSVNYYYQTQFDLTGRDPTSAVVHGQWATDNGGIDVLINGLSTGQSNPFQFTSWTPFRIDHGFVPGLNTLTFVVNNGAGETTVSGPTGLRVEMRGTALSSCIDFQTFLPMSLPTPWVYQGIQFLARDQFGSPFLFPGIRSGGGFTGLNCGWQLEMDFPSPCNSVDLTLVHFAAPAFAMAYDASGTAVATAGMIGPSSVAEALRLNGTGITRVVIVSPSGEAWLLGLCCRAGRPPPTDLQALALNRLRAASTEPVKIRFAGGIPRFVQGRFPIPAGTVADPVARALDFLTQHRELYRLEDPRAQLYLNRIVSNELGQHLFFGQRRDKVNVFGAEIAVHLDAEAVSGANGNYLTELPPDGTPTLAASAAEVIALSQMNCPNASRVGQAKLVYFSPGLFVTTPTDLTTRLAWQLTVADCGEGDWFYFIDAQSGAVLFRLSLSPTHAARKDFGIRTANNSTAVLCHYVNATEWFTQSGALLGVTPDAEGISAFNFTHQIYDFYFTNFHRHSWDGHDGTIRIVLDEGGSGAGFRAICNFCRFENNFATLDVMAHEITHGVTASSANLLQQDQPGALNESYSDVMAAMIDTANWTIGEGSPRGTIRSLADPSASPFRHPDRMRDFKPLPVTDDFGGVHSNNGIPNKAAFLIAEGGVFNGITVRGIGRPKTAALYYYVLTSILTWNSQFIDAADATKQMARTYAATGLHGFTQADACSVADAFAAVDLGLPDLDCDGVDDTVDTDDDGDGVGDTQDNCPRMGNPAQTDTDGDSLGDACDLDDDKDRIPDKFDNCPRHDNPNQADFDHDGIGDACDDSDADGVTDAIDNCPRHRNPDQANFDTDKMGDPCDLDDDNDTILDDFDNCHTVGNFGQADADRDGIGDACDSCPSAVNTGDDTDRDGIDNACDPDDDDDGVPDVMDNCPLVKNPSQHDLNGNRVGTACDSSEALDFGRVAPDLIEGALRFRQEHFEKLQILIFPDLGAIGRDWIPEHFVTEIRLQLGIDLPVQITDDQGFVVARAEIGLEKILRFHPKADTFYRPPTGPPGLRPAGVDVLPYYGRQYYLEILPTTAVEPGRAYYLRIEGSSTIENLLSIESITNAGGAVTLIWSALPGKTYRVQFKSDLNAGSWTYLSGDITVSGVTASIVDETFGMAKQRFYRVVELP